MFSFKVGLPTKLVDLFELPHRAILILLPHFLRTSILGGVRLVRCLLSWEISESSGFCNFSSKGTVITIFHKIISLKNFLSLLKSLFRKRLAFLTLLWCHWCSQVYISVLNKWRSGQTRVCIERVDKKLVPPKIVSLINSFGLLASPLLGHFNFWQVVACGYIKGYCTTLRRLSHWSVSSTLWWRLSFKNHSLFDLFTS